MCDFPLGGKDGLAYPCTTMKNSTAKVMGPGSQWKCEVDSTELKLHGDETNHGL